jgi:hypothetical protein
MSETVSFPERAASIRLSTARFCGLLGWARVHEMTLPNGRRADIMALRPDGGLVCIEIKSGPRDFLVDSKWPEYRDFSDALYFAVDPEFPAKILPEDTGLIVAAADAADIMRPAPSHPLAPARRKAMLQRFATLAALRLATFEDPAGAAELRAALRVE